MMKIYNSQNHVSPKPVAPGIGIEMSLEVTGETVAQFAPKLGLTPEQLEQLMGGELPFTLEIAAALEREWGTDRRIWLSMENAYQQHPKRRGGKREGAGRKPLGHASKLVRISAPLEQMREINTWLEQQPSAAQRLAQLILEEARKSA